MPRAGEKGNQRAVNKYNKTHYERIVLVVSMGEKDGIKQHAEIQGESLNAFLRRAVYEQMARDRKKTPLN